MPIDNLFDLLNDLSSRKITGHNACAVVLKNNNDFSVSILPELATFSEQVSDEDSTEMKERV